MIKVCVGGKFDPVHDGHIDHILKASALGDYLFIMVHPDEIVAKTKGKCDIPLWARIAVLRGILSFFKIRGKVVITIDTDGTVTKTLDWLQPHFFAKGGDRTPDNMPEAELKMCKRDNIQIIYNTGTLLNSSSKIMG